MNKKISVRLFRDIASLRSAVAPQQGATILEFALAFPIFLVMILGIVDLSRYFATLAVLNAGAHEGLMVATKIPNLDLDTTKEDVNSDNYKRFTQAREFVTSAAVTIPFGTIIGSPDSTDAIKLTTQQLSDDLSGGTKKYTSSDIALLRPGECAVSSNDSKETCNNETLNTPTPAPTPAGSGANAPPPPPVTSSPTAPQELMKVHPIKIVLSAKVESYLPFFGSYTATGSANGFREKDIPEGPFAGEEPTTTPLPSVTPEPPGTLPQAIEEEEPEEFVNCDAGAAAIKLAVEDWRYNGGGSGTNPRVLDIVPIGANPGDPCQSRTKDSAD